MPNFPELRTSKSKDGEVQVLRITTRKKINRNKASGILWVPVALIGNAKGRDYTLDTDYGISAAWINFFTEYMEYAVSKWESFRYVRRWILQDHAAFIKGVQQL